MLCVTQLQLWQTYTSFNITFTFSNQMQMKLKLNRAPGLRHLSPDRCRKPGARFNLSGAPFKFHLHLIAESESNIKTGVRLPKL